MSAKPLLWSTLLSLVVAPVSAFETKQQLGQALYFDPNLSLNRTQSCATCHDPAAGFVDPRDNSVKGAVSLGDDGKSLGGRHAPSAAYARFSPAFKKGSDGKYVGGQFHDGRANSLAEQAAGPPTNPLEMGMPSKQAVAERLKENPAYVSAFKTLFDEKVLGDSERLYAAMSESIGEFEKTELFAPFDSKYDRYLRGEYKMTDMEELGRTLFFSQQFTNCNLCHQLQKTPGREQETFTNYQYHNIGVPANPDLAVAPDEGLLANPAVQEASEKGKFKVPTLRNVAVTGPYMHNGVFQDLRTVVLFYDKYNSKSAKRQINPETGETWAEPEIAENLSLKELETGPALKEVRIDALVAFLKTLTDKRYEEQL